MPESLKQKSIKSILWSFSSRSCIQVVQFIISIILARLLSPEDYGVVGLAYVAIALVECFGNLGIGGAAVQQKEIDELDFNTYFWAEACIRFLIFGVIFFTAPFFATYYKKPILTKLIRVIVISGLLGIIQAVPNLKMTRAMDFKTPSLIGVVATIISSLIAIVCAFSDLGMWVLVVQNVVSTFVSTVLLLWRCPWWPHLQFSWKRFCIFINFGYKLLFSGILDCLYNNISSLIIGKAFSIEALGFYNKGNKVPQLAMNAINTPINGIAFPMFSRLPDDPEKYKAAMRHSLKTSLFFIAPLLTLLAIVARPLVMLLYGEKWLPAVPFFRIMAIVYIFYPIQTLNLGAILGKGRSDIFLKLEIKRKTIGILLKLLFFPFGLIWFVGSSLLDTFFCVIINTSPLKRLVGYSTLAQLADIWIGLIGSIVMAALLIPLNYLKIHVLLTLCIQIPLGVLVYVAFNYFFNKVFLLDCLAILKHILHR